MAQTAIESNLLVILGPTASGKTRLGVEAAMALNGEIVSADSRQVYRGLDIGSGKDLDEYGEIPCHLIDIVDPGQEFSLFSFVRQFIKAFTQIRQHQKMPILVGGTGMYLDAILSRYRLVEVPENPALRRELEAFTIDQLRQELQGLRPQQHNTTDLNDRERLVRAIEIATGEQAEDAEPIELPEIVSRVYGLQWPREVLRSRITRRLKERLEGGLIEEVECLHGSGVSWETLEFYGLEYRFVAHHLQGKLSRNDLFQKLNSAIHQFAKRQETWFRRMEKQGVSIQWLDATASPLALLLDDWGRLGK